MFNVVSREMRNSLRTRKNYVKRSLDMQRTFGLSNLILLVRKLRQGNEFTFTVLFARAYVLFNII